jgi:pimeloyl-ACP methyl ester carboxylesterase
LSPASATRWCRSLRRTLLRRFRTRRTTIAGAAHAPFLSHPAPFLDALAAFVDG